MSEFTVFKSLPNACFAMENFGKLAEVMGEVLKCPWARPMQDELAYKFAVKKGWPLYLIYAPSESEFLRYLAADTRARIVFVDKNVLPPEKYAKRCALASDVLYLGEDGEPKFAKDQFRRLWSDHKIKSPSSGGTLTASATMKRRKIWADCLAWLVARRQLALERGQKLVPAKMAEIMEFFALAFKKLRRQAPGKRTLYDDLAKFHGDKTIDPESWEGFCYIFDQLDKSDFIRDQVARSLAELVAQITMRGAAPAPTKYYQDPNA